MELHDQAAAYVLGILEGDEVQQFEQHLETCDTCQIEVQQLQGSSELLFDAAYESPPEGLKNRVMQSIDSIEQPVSLQPSGMSRARLWSWISAAAVVIAVVAVGLSGLLAGDPVADILGASDATPISIAASGDDPSAIADLVLVYSPSLGQAVLRGLDLIPTADGEIYQMWLIGASGPVPAGIFQPDENGRVSVLIQGEPAIGEVFGITVEPAGGSDQPTGEVLFSGEV